jgi:hypothetical protein
LTSKIKKINLKRIMNMKKYMILAAVALVASAACTKVENTVEAPNQAIAFQVANYVPQTKTGEVKFDEANTFTTYAWFHPTSGAAQVFMSGETIKWQETTKQWAADRTYYWPKTGDVSFYSYAGTPAPTTVSDGSAVYTEKTIAITDDAVLASAARHYGASDANLNSYSGILYGTSNTDVTGVPTLFHHILAKVSFVIKFSAEGITDTKNKWDLVVNSASLEYANVGTLTVNFADGSKGQYWPFSADTYNWVPKDGAANYVQAAPAGTNAVAFDGAANKQTVTAKSDGTAISDGITILDEITVMPQVLATSAAKFRINYTLTSYYDGVKHIEETVNLSDTGTDPLGVIALTAFSGNAITQWNMNYKYTYTVTIKPNKTVTFDPAVEAWSTDSAGYTYPNE